MGVVLTFKKMREFMTESQEKIAPNVRGGMNQISKRQLEPIGNTLCRERGMRKHPINAAVDDFDFLGSNGQSGKKAAQVFRITIAGEPSRCNHEHGCGFKRRKRIVGRGLQKRQNRVQGIPSVEIGIPQITAAHQPGFYPVIGRIAIDKSFPIQVRGYRQFKVRRELGERFRYRKKNFAPAANYVFMKAPLGQKGRGILVDGALDWRFRQGQIKCYKAAQSFAIDADFTGKISGDKANRIELSLHQRVDRKSPVLRHNKYIVPVRMHEVRQFGENQRMAAGEMLKRLQAHNFLQADKGETTFEIGIGLSSGKVVAGNIGAEDRKEYTVIGDAVNLASRHEGLTKYYGAQIIIDEAVREKLSDSIMPLRELDSVRVKGRHAPCKIYQAIHENEPTA